MSAIRLRGSRGPTAIAVGLVLALTAIALRTAGSDDDALPTESARPGPDVPRSDEHLTVGFLAQHVAMVADFDLRRNRLVLLDAANAQVFAFAHGDSGWQSEWQVGRRGGGPGEFANPTGVAIAPDGSVYVADESRLHLFAADGTYLRSTILAVDCQLIRPMVAATASGRYVSGTCRRALSDSILAALHWTRNDSSYIRLTSDLRYMRQGGSGLPLGSLSLFSDGAQVHHFGAGTSNCISRITETDSVPLVDRQCALVSSQYRAVFPRELQLRLQQERARRPQQRRLFELPEAWPPYMSAADVAGRTVLVRSFTDDSLVFQVAPAGADLLVTGAAGFANCRAEACLWARVVPDGASVTVLPLRNLEQHTRAR